MTKEQKVTQLLAKGADETGRLALDEIDAKARDNDTWGTSGHRQAREKVERTYDHDKSVVEKLSESELDKALG
ncbi:MAG: hypothetical protein ACKVVT_17375 [Dehalococcoidia bacterium]